MNERTEYGNLREITRDPGLMAEISQVRAKAVLTEVLGESPAFKWTYLPSRLARNTTAALLELETMSLVTPTLLEQSSESARRLAQTWESLAILEEGASRISALMNAAVAYELAGYQANSACLARDLVIPSRSIGRPSLPELVALFLQRKLILVRQLAPQLESEPEEVPHAEEFMHLASEALAASGLSLAAQYFLTGNSESMLSAQRRIADALNVHDQLGLVRDANILRGLSSLLPLMSSRSIWALLRDEVSSDGRWNRYLKLLARGTGQDVLLNTSVAELWPSQLLALQAGLLSSWDSKLVRMPTSAGKTRIAEIAMAHALVTSSARCIYVAPFRALAGEIEHTFLNLFSDLGYRVNSVIGTYESDTFEDAIVADADILVVTPEKLDLLTRLHPEAMDHFDLFILDEGQLIEDPTRGLKYEILLARLRSRRPDAKFLFLSAVVSDETLRDLAQWLHLNTESGVVSTEWRPSIQRVAKLVWSGRIGTLRYSPLADAPMLAQFVPGVITQESYVFTNPATSRTNTRRFPERGHKAQTAAELAFKFSELGPTLVFCPQRDLVEYVGKALSTRLTLMRRTEKAIPARFVTEGTRSALAAREWLGEEHPITRFLRSGIAIHHGGLPDAVRAAVEVDFRERRYKVIVATTTLAQGVNLPIRTVIVHSCWINQQDEHGNLIQTRVAARDYWNIAGRAGRAGEETEGTIIHIVKSARDEADFRYYLSMRSQLPPLRSALIKLLEDLIAERLSPQAASQQLDPEILGLLMEEQPESIDSWTDAVLSRTLAFTQAARTGVSLDPLRRSITNTATSILERVPDANLLAVYGTTGLTTAGCEDLRGAIVATEGRVRSLLTEAGAAQVPELAEAVLAASLRLQELQTRVEFPGSYTDLMRSWIGGIHISEMRDTFSSEEFAPEQLAKFIEEFFSYRLPWVASSFVRIACKVLGLDPTQLSDAATFFPSMLKYGVPFPEASWAMSTGIPYRDVAISIGGRYLKEVPETSFEGFQLWISRIDSEELREVYGLQSPVLEDVSRALARSSQNPLLALHADLTDLFPLDFEVRGVRYGARRNVAGRLRVGDAIELRRDYENQFDRNAVAVTSSGAEIGYVPRSIAQLIAPEIDSGTPFVARVVSIDAGVVPHVTAVLSHVE